MEAQNNETEIIWLKQKKKKISKIKRSKTKIKIDKRGDGV